MYTPPVHASAAREGQAAQKNSSGTKDSKSRINFAKELMITCVAGPIFIAVLELVYVGSILTAAPFWISYKNNQNKLISKSLKEKCALYGELFIKIIVCPLMWLAAIFIMMYGIVDPKRGAASDNFMGPYVDRFFPNTSLFSTPSI